MRNVLLASMLCLSAVACGVEQEELGTDEAALEKGEPGDVSAQYFRWQCGANTASLRDAPGGTVLEQIGYGEGVEVIGDSGAWFYVVRLANNHRGWTLKTYYCP